MGRKEFKQQMTTKLLTRVVSKFTLFYSVLDLKGSAISSNSFKANHGMEFSVMVHHAIQDLAGWLEVVPRMQMAALFSSGAYARPKFLSRQVSWYFQ